MQDRLIAINVHECSYNCKNLDVCYFSLEETADWEKELQQELQEYEVVTESEKRDDNWDKEIEEMLQGD